MQANADCVEFWNGWFRKVRKGDILDPHAIVLSHIPANVVWEGNHGRMVNI